MPQRTTLLLAAVIAAGCAATPPDRSSARFPPPPRPRLDLPSDPTRYRDPPLEPPVTIRPPTTPSLSAVPRTAASTTTPTTVAIATSTADVPIACAEQRLDGSGFEPDSVEIPTTLDNQLLALASWILDGHYQRIQVAGNTDNRPTPLGNDLLSLLRAQQVVARLRALGVLIPIDVEAHGANQPLDTANTEQAWAMNRRVDVTAFCTPPNAGP